MFKINPLVQIIEMMLQILAMNFYGIYLYQILGLIIIFGLIIFFINITFNMHGSIVKIDIQLDQDDDEYIIDQDDYKIDFK